MTRAPMIGDVGLTGGTYDSLASRACAARGLPSAWTSTSKVISSPTTGSVAPRGNALMCRKRSGAAARWTNPKPRSGFQALTTPVSRTVRGTSRWYLEQIPEPGELLREAGILLDVVRIPRE